MRVVQNLVGQKFGKLVVNERHFPNAKNGNSRWSCLCECGNTTVVNADALKRDLVKSCGCLNSPNLTGSIFGRLRVIERCEENNNFGQTLWRCLCDCGTSVVVSIAGLKNNTKSCGCLRKENTKIMSTVHGLRYSPEYRAWAAMKNRCSNENSLSYSRYGGRNITVCDEWKESFEAFYRDMGSKPSDKHSIDRKDNDKGYCKENCRWATPVEQANNKRKTVFYYYNGTYKTLSAWCRELGLSYKTIYNRVCIQGSSLEDAISVNKQSSKGINHV